MKSYEYEAKIISTDAKNKVMTVVYTSPGRRDLVCGVMMPESEDQLGEAIHDAVPFGVWEQDERSVYVPQIGVVVKGIVRSGQLPGPAVDAPALPFSTPISLQPQGHEANTKGGAGEEATEAGARGFPTRYVGQAETVDEPQGFDRNAPEVNL